MSARNLAAGVLLGFAAATIGSQPEREHREVELEDRAREHGHEEDGPGLVPLEHPEMAVAVEEGHGQDRQEVLRPDLARVQHGPGGRGEERRRREGHEGAEARAEHEVGEGDREDAAERHEGGGEHRVDVDGERQGEQVHEERGVVHPHARSQPHLRPLLALEDRQGEVDGDGLVRLELHEVEVAEPQPGGDADDRAQGQELREAARLHAVPRIRASRSRAAAMRTGSRTRRARHRRW